MATPYQPSEVIQIAELSQSYAGQDIVKSALFSPALNQKLDKILYTERKSLEWAHNLSPTLSTLQEVANYVYSLCGKYGAKAIANLGGGGGGIIVNPTIPSSVGIAFDYVRRIYARDFTNGADYFNDWIAGYEAEVLWVNGNQRVLDPEQGEIRYSPSGFTVWIDDGSGGNAFDVRTTNADVFMVVWKKYPTSSSTPTGTEIVTIPYDLTANTQIDNLDLTQYAEGQEITFSIKANGYDYTWDTQFEWSDNLPEQPTANVVNTYTLYRFQVVVDKLVIIDYSLNIPI